MANTSQSSTAQLKLATSMERTTRDARPLSAHSPATSVRGPDHFVARRVLGHGRHDDHAGRSAGRCRRWRRRLATPKRKDPPSPFAGLTNTPCGHATRTTARPFRADAVTLVSAANTRARRNAGVGASSGNVALLAKGGTRRLCFACGCGSARASRRGTIATGIVRSRRVGRVRRIPRAHDHTGFRHGVSAAGCFAAA